MHSSHTWAAAFLFCGLFISSAANAQSPVEDEIPPLPTTLSTEQLQFSQSLKVVSVSETPQLDPRLHLPRPERQLSPEQVGYKLAVQKLGVDKHRFVHCDLPNGKVRTGVITEILDEGFTLKDGIINSQWIPYTDLRAAPRPVAAVGTRIGQGLKWTALGIGMVAMLPLFPLLWVGLGDC